MIELLRYISVVLDGGVRETLLIVLTHLLSSASGSRDRLTSAVKCKSLHSQIQRRSQPSWLVMDVLQLTVCLNLTIHPAVTFSGIRESVLVFAATTCISDV